MKSPDLPEALKYRVKEILRVVAVEKFQDDGAMSLHALKSLSLVNVHAMFLVSFEL